MNETFLDEKRPSSTSSYLEEEARRENVPFVKSEAEKRYIRKLNIRLLPLAMIIVFLQFVDKTTLSIAAIIGILQDTGTSKANLSWLGALFYLGYFIWQPANNVLLQRLSVGKYLGGLLICWGGITIATAFGKSFAAQCVLRVFLGLFEAGTYPGLNIIFNTMYRRSEQSACFGFLYLSNGVAILIGSASAAGIINMGTVHGVKAWQWAYIIWGIITVIFGIISLICLIDSPQSWLLQLTEEEKVIVDLRTRDNAVVRKQRVDVSQYWEALSEPRLWLLFIASFSHNLQNGGLLTFGNVLVNGLGFNAEQTVLLQIPSGVITVICIASAILIHRKTSQMLFTGVIFYTISATGCLLLAVLPQGGIKLLGYYLTWAQGGAYVMIITIIGSTVSGYSKKIFYFGTNMMAYTLGNFCGPLMLVDKTAPAYVPTMWGYFGANILNIICFLLLRVILARSNKKRASQCTGEVTDVYLNLTDKQDKNYVYSL